MTTQRFTKRTMLKISGPLTARQAWDIVQPVARTYDSGARLRLIVSGEDISHRGDSHTWEFLFDLPHQQAQLICRVDADFTEQGDEGFMVLHEEHVVSDVSSGGAAGARQSDVARPGLPAAFIDSPEAVQALAEQGVDFISGPTNMVLSAEVPAAGEPVWRIWQYDDEYRTPFA